MASMSSSIRMSFGASRILTSKFKEFRGKKSQKKSKVQVSSFKGSEKLLDSLEAEEKVKACIPPLWVDDYDTIKEELKTLDDDLRALEKISRDQMINTFKKETHESIQKARFQSQTVQKKIYEIDLMLKKFLNHEGPSEDRNVRKNVISNLKVKLRELTLRFKKVQEGKMKKKSMDLDSPDYDLADEFGDREKIFESTDESLMNKEIDTLATNMVQLAEIFKELNEFIILQGTIFDRIDYSLQCAAENTKQSVHHLKGAQKHQKCTRVLGCITCLIVLIFVLIISLGLKIYL